MEKQYTVANMSLVEPYQEIPRKRLSRRRPNRKIPRPRLSEPDEFYPWFNKLQMDDDYSIEIPLNTLDPYLQELFEKKSSARESALRTLVKEFETNVHYAFAEDKFFTLVHRCQNCLKRGSAMEIDLALHLIGLVVLTLGAGDNAHEVYKESLEFLPKLLIKSKLSHAVKVKVIECLSIVTLVGAKDFVEIERSMEIIWNFISKYSSFEAAALISAWALLLSDIDPWSISPKKWKGLIPYLLKQLERDDEHINIVSIEALALIFENGSLEKFSNEADKYASIKDMKDSIMEHVKRVCKGVKQEASKILEDDYDKRNIVTIGVTRITFSTWSQLKQMSYIRKYLGYGFTNHMMENEHLHDVFRFAPALTPASIPTTHLELNKPEREEVSVRVFVPEVKRRDCKKRIHMSPSSQVSKGRTKLMNKRRNHAEKNKSGLSIADEEHD